MPRGEVRGFSPDKLRDHRQAKGYSIDLLADLAGVSPPTIGAWERGTRSPRPNASPASQKSSTSPAATSWTRDHTTLRDLRQGANLTRNEVCAKLRCSPVTLNYLEKGRRPLHDDDVEYLAALYKVTPEQVRAAAETSAADWQAVLDKARKQRNTPQPKSGGVARAS